jgi:CBS domain-containing protein
MTPDLVAAPAATTLGDLSRMMRDAHIHRVIVVDKEGRPIGVVSSTDVLAAVAHADAARRSAPAPEPEGDKRRPQETCHC